MGRGADPLTAEPHRRVFTVVVPQSGRAAKESVGCAGCRGEPRGSGEGWGDAGRVVHWEVGGVGVWHLGVVAPNYGDELSPGRLRSLAEQAERLRFDCVWVTDHIAVPTALAPTYGAVAEALVTLGFLAAVTNEISLGVSALVVPQRQLLLALKQVMTVQYLAQGRLVLAVAAGWTEQEFTNLGARMSSRRRQLRAWRALVQRTEAVTPGRLDLDVDGLSITDATIAPGFVGGIVPQMWMAGHADGAIDRAAELGVWHPVGRPVRVVRELARRFHELRPDGKIVLRVAVSLRTEPDVAALDSDGRCRIEGPAAFVLESLEAFRQVGVDGFVLDLLRGQGPLEDRVEEFAMAVAPALRE